MTNVTIYHNPRCSKSRQTLALLEEAGATIDIINYLENPPTAEELRSLLNKLGLTPRQLMREKEAPFAELNLANNALAEDDLIAAMVNQPILIERPIVVAGKKAAIGRPPENVKSIL